MSVYILATVDGDDVIFRAATDDGLSKVCRIKDAADNGTVPHSNPYLLYGNEVAVLLGVDKSTLSLKVFTPISGGL